MLLSGSHRANKFIAACLLFITSCGQQSATPGLPGNHFDIPGFFKTEIAILNQSDPLLVKTVTISGKTGKSRVPHADWVKELQPFLNTDLNGKALHRWLKADTLFIPGGFILHYTSRDPDSKFRSADICFIGSTADSVSIRLTGSNLYGSEDHLLQYHAQKNYKIHFSGTTSFGKDKRMEVSGKILPVQQGAN